jgi:hypothetical protein
MNVRGLHRTAFVGASMAKAKAARDHGWGLQATKYSGEASDSSAAMPAVRAP